MDSSPGFLSGLPRRGGGAISHAGDPDLGKLRVAVVHEWFSAYAGSERVVEQLLLLFPQAEVFGVVDFLPDSERAFLGGRRVHTTFIQQLPGARRNFRRYLPLMPLAIEQHDLSSFDLVISSSHAVAKGVITGPHQKHVSYVHSPMRYAWDLQHQYLHESGLERGAVSWVARAALHQMRNWDARTALGVDHFIANSHFIARRIEKVYRRSADVVYPPVDIDRFTVGTQREDFYLTASRMVPYKRVPLIVEAFTHMPNKTLVVIGEGEDMTRARAVAGPNVRFLGHVPFESLRNHMQRAKAFVFAAEEDFGITAVEAQACGCPVIAYGRGGSLETVRPIGEASPTGLFFLRQTEDALVDAVAAFERQGGDVSAASCRRNAERFAPEQFAATLRASVVSALRAPELRG
jgi:glycosyltransferase involved in cell wall biosynthesis